MVRAFFAAVLFLSALLLFVGCGGGGQVPLTRSVILGQEFSLTVGQGAYFAKEGLTLVSRGVSQDSRCPEGAQCISAGSATALIEMSTTGQTSPTGRSVTLGTGLAGDGVFQNYRVRLVALRPYPKLNQAISPNRYVATLTVSKE